MTLEQLRIFVAVAERLHMTRAAESLNISQSAASAAVAALEARHSVRLFDRVGRGLALSDAGRLFLAEARAVLARADAASQVLDDLAGLKRGHVSIAASQTLASYWLPPRLARFADQYPGIELTLTAGNTAQVSVAVAEGLADLGFVEGAIHHPLLVRERLAEDRIALFAAPDHPLTGVKVKPAVLRNLRWVLREQGSGTRSEFNHGLTRIGVEPAEIRAVLELPSNEAVLAAAAEYGGLVTAVSELAARPLIGAGRLVQLDLDLGVRAFELITHKERMQSHAAEAFINALRS